MTTELLPAEDPTDLAAIPAADSPAIWENFRSTVQSLKLTAETLNVTDISQTAEMKLARTTRLALKSIRVEIEKHRKQLGEVYLRKTQKINSEAKTIKDVIESLEAKLLENEQFAEREEANRLKLIADAEAEAERIRIEEELAQEEKLARLAKIRMEIENKRLKKLAEAQQEEIAKERAERNAERQAAEEKAELARKAAAQIAATEVAARKQAEEALRETHAEANRIKAEAETAKQRAASAPDREKLVALAAKVRGLEMPSLAGELGPQFSAQISDQFEKFAAWLERKSEEI